MINLIEAKVFGNGTAVEGRETLHSISNGLLGDPNSVYI
jgi:hypothetical protein